jgi:Tfp pilus assembly protein PilN
MKAINLIPRLPFAQQYLKPLMTGIIAFSVLSSSLLVIGYAQSSHTSGENDRLLQEKQAQASILMKERVVDQQTLQYQSLKGKVDVLKGEIRDWQPVFQGITASLPTAARILSMEADESGKIKLHLDMKDLRDAAQYMLLLQQLNLFHNVTVNSVQKKELAYPVPVAIISSGTTASSPSASPSTDKTQSMTFEQYVNMFQKPSASASDATEADELLNQLDWMMSQKISKEVNGITLPGRTPQPVATPTGSGPITRQDVEDAQKKLDGLTKAKVAEPTSQAAAEATPAPKVLTLYDVVLELICKPLIKEKKE